MNSTELLHREDDTVFGVLGFENGLHTDHSFVEQVGLAHLYFFLAIDINGLFYLFDSGDTCPLHIVAQERQRGVAVEVAILADKVIIYAVEFAQVGF